MENQKKSNYGQESYNTEKPPRVPDYQDPILKDDSDDYVDFEKEVTDNPEAPLYPNQSRNEIDSNSASDIQNKDDEDHDREDDEEEDEDDDDFTNEEVFEEDDDFQEKDIDYREKKERDSF